MSKKQQRNIELFIVDIFVAIKKAKEYTKIFDNAEELRTDSLRWDATIRQLEVIGEALNKLLENENFNALSPKYFRKIVNFRNVVVHGYFGIDSDEVWDVLGEKLDILSDDLKNIVDKHIDLSVAIVSEISEYEKLGAQEIVAYLQSFLNHTKLENKHDN